MKILTSVRFNNTKAYVLDKSPDYIYYKLGNDIIYGTDGLFYICYKYERPSNSFKAFGGREFKITLNTGEVINCNGQWWSGGEVKLEKELGLKLTHITYNTTEELKKCYVYYGACVDYNKLKDLLEETGELYYHDYYDYEKIIKYQDIWNNRREEEKKLNKKIEKLQKDKNILISKIKSFYKIVKIFKNQKFISNE